MITAQEIILSIPKRFRQEKAKGIKMRTHFIIEADFPLIYTVDIENETCTLTEGKTGVADCTVRCQEKLYVDLETGKANPQWELVRGKLKVDGLSQMLQFSKCFRKFNSSFLTKDTNVHSTGNNVRPELSGPLKGIRILDFSRLLPGPLGSMFLADLGAEVIKLEDPDSPDYVRDFEPKWDEHSVFYHALNQGKKSLSINYISEEGKQIILDMIPSVDVVIEQFRPGVMAGLGLDYDTMKKRNPGIVYAAITGYGQADHRAGHDLNFIAESGLLYQLGTPDKIVIPGFQTADVAGGSYMLLAALLAALLKKQRTGVGSYLDISMTDAVIPLQAMSLADFQVNRIEPERGNTPLSGGLPNYNVYECNDKKWIALGSLEPKFWEPFCRKVNQENWISAPFLSPAERQKVSAEVQAMFHRKSQKEWLNFFSDMDICLSPVKNIQEALENQEFRNRQVFECHLVNGKPELTTLRFPVAFAPENKQPRWQAPELGEDSYALLKSIGYDDDQITALVSKGIIRTA